MAVTDRSSTRCRRSRASSPGRARVVDATHVAGARGTARGRRSDVARPVGRRRLVHMALLGGASGVAVASLACAEGGFPSVAALHPPAIRLERAIHDLFGCRPHGAPDERPWLDHGRWPRARREPRAARTAMPFCQRRRGPASDSGRPGPCRHHRARPFPLHRQWRDDRAAGGAARLCPQGRRAPDGRGAARPRRASSPARVSGDSTVAYALAFARAVEAALGIEVPPRAVWLRALMAELERLANHLGDIGAICNDAAFALMLAHCAVLREQRAARLRRLLRPSADDGRDRARRRRRRSPRRTARAYPARACRRHPTDASPPGRALRQHRLAAGPHGRPPGRLDPALARQFGCGGFIGRASGRDFRRAPRSRPTRPMTGWLSTSPVLEDGDVNARVWIRIREVEQSLGLIEQILHAPAGRGRPRAWRQAKARAKAWRWSRAFAATFSPGSGSTAVRCDAAICAIRPGSNGRCWKPRSRATSSPIFRSATNPSTAPIRGTISEARRCARFCSRPCGKRR